jgi:hypothetical protein
VSDDPQILPPPVEDTSSTQDLPRKMENSSLTYREVAEKTGHAKSAVWKAVHHEDPLGIMNAERLRSQIADILT